MAVRTNRKEAPRQKAKMEAEEEFRRQVKRERAYRGMTQNELAAQVPLPPATFSDYLKEPGQFRVWQLGRIAQILELDPGIIQPMLGFEVSV